LPVTRVGGRPEGRPPTKRQLWRGTDWESSLRGDQGGGSRPAQPATATPGRQVRPPRRHQRGSSRVRG
jgi:hypothetical protein